MGLPDPFLRPFRTYLPAGKLIKDAKPFLSVKVKAVAMVSPDGTMYTVAIYIDSSFPSSVTLTVKLDKEAELSPFTCPHTRDSPMINKK